MQPLDAAALLFDEKKDRSAAAADLDTAVELLAILERCSVLAVEEGGRHRLHGSHAGFVRERILCFPMSRALALSRWRRHVGTAAAFFSWPVEDLVEIWRTVAELSGPGEAAVERPYDAVLAGMDGGSAVGGGSIAGKFSTVLERVARFHAMAGDLREARVKYTRLVALCESNLKSSRVGGGGDGGGGASKLRLADHLHSLGAVSVELGAVKEADAANSWACSLRQEVLGADHPQVGSSLQALAACASAAGMPDAEQRLLRKALSIWDGGDGGGNAGTGGGGGRHGFDLDAARALQTLGGYAIQQGRRGEAERLLRRAVAAWESALGGDHPGTARALHSLGVCAFDGGKTEQAGELYRRALRIRQRRLGPRHPEVASTMHSLGVCEWKAGRVDEAESLYRKTLAIRVEKLGPEHLHVARTLHSLGSSARHGGRFGEATAMYRKALEIGEARLGPGHPEVLKQRASRV